MSKRLFSAEFDSDAESEVDADLEADDLVDKLLTKFPRAVCPFLLSPELIEILAMSRIKLYFNIFDHDIYEDMWNKNFRLTSRPLHRAIGRFDPGRDRIWNFDYPFEGANNADKGTGVSIFAIASADEVFDLMGYHESFRTIREVIMPGECGYARYFIDWDEKKPLINFFPGPTIMDTVRQRIKMLTDNFMKMIKEEYWYKIKPMVSLSTRRDKISIHVVFTGVCFSLYEDFRCFDRAYTDQFVPSHQNKWLDKANHTNENTHNCLAFFRTIKSRKSLSDKGVFFPIGLRKLSDIDFEDFTNHLIWSPVKRGDVNVRTAAV